MKKTKRNSDLYAVKRLRLLEFMLARGFEPIAERPDATKIHYKNWLFEKTPEFKKALDEYFNEAAANR